MFKMMLVEIVKDMVGIDIVILLIYIDNGEIVNCFMSNNGDVFYDGMFYYFVFEKIWIVLDIQCDLKVVLGFLLEVGLFLEGVYVVVEGVVELICDKVVFQWYWICDFDKWFEKGIDMLGIVLIKVRVNWIIYWKGCEEGEVEF